MASVVFWFLFFYLFSESIQVYFLPDHAVNAAGMVVLGFGASLLGVVLYGLIVMMIRARSIATRIQMPARIVAVALLGLLGWIPLLRALNADFDRGVSQVVELPVEGLHCSVTAKYEIETCTLRLGGIERHPPAVVRISGEEYERLLGAKIVVVTSGPGFFRVPHYRSFSPK